MKDGSQTYAHRLTGDCRCGQRHDNRPSTPQPSRNEAKRRIADTNNYTDEDGALLFQVVRFDPKGFSQRQPDGKGDWILNLKGVRRVLYRLPELIAADPAQPVFICEGEKDVESLAVLGLVATTNPMGAGKWLEEYSQWLKGRNVVVLPHNDKSGHQHGQIVAQSVYGVARSVKVLDLPGLAEGGGDVTDWLNEGHTGDELMELAGSAPEWSPNKPDTPEASRPLTQLGNAERFVDAYGQQCRWVPQWGWMRFNGQRWSAVEEEGAEHLAVSVVRGIYEEASEEPDQERRAKIAAWAKTSESRAQISAMVHLARGYLPAKTGNFDQHLRLFNVPNGTIDLATQKIRPHDPADFLTKMSPVDLDPKATCPRWIAFLKRIFCGAPAIIGYLQAVVGYSLTGSTNEQMALILYGLGENGKTTLIETLLALFGPGEYAAKASFETFLDSDKGGPRDGLAALAGCRLVVASESAAGRNFNEPLIKEATGGETITARFLYKTAFSFEAQFQLWLATNNRPVVREQTHAFWRRLRLIPFVETITAEEKIPDLGEKLKEEELSGILNWALAGCRLYLEEGLVTPESVVSATSDYRVDEDPLADFLDSYCVLETEASQPPAPLYQAYKNSCDSNGQKPLTPAWFSRVLVQKGIVRTNRASGSRGDYTGIRLRRTD